MPDTASPQNQPFSPLKPVCTYCGSDRIVRDARARWDTETRQWQFAGVEDFEFCDACNAEGVDIVRWVAADPTVNVLTRPLRPDAAGEEPVMRMTREQIIYWLINDSYDTCRQDEGYLRSILRSYWGDMSDDELRRSYHDLCAQEDEPEPVDADALTTVTLRFMPHAWINDWAMPVDTPDHDNWEVPLSLLLEHFPTEQEWHDRAYDRDDLRFEGTAPLWMRDWPSPFEVELLDGQAPWESVPAG